MANSSNMADFPHRVTEAVRFSETDMLGHVNNTVFGIYFEVGRSTYLSDQGFYRQSGLNLVIIKTEILYLGMIYWPGSVTVGTRAGKGGRSSFAMEQVLYQGDRVVGQSSSTMVLIDDATGKSTPIPEDIRAMLKLEDAQ